MAERGYARRLPIGAEPLPTGGVHFRVWAPRRKRVEVLLEEKAPGAKPGLAMELTAEPEGYFSGLMEEARAGALYRFRLDGGDSFPDPASRFQPQGPHGPSEVVDSAAYRWRDNHWHGAKIEGQVIYELHLGTFTRDGDWASAAAELPELADLGVTCLELMPVAEFAGRFNWGYDGVYPYAPCRVYGRPDDFRAFVDAAHAVGIAVILDVVYNHFGPDGCYVRQFSEEYFTDRYATDWGEAINFDGPHCGPVREYFYHNAGYWIDEYHLDGLRLDATQNIYDDSADHILTAITRRVHHVRGARTTLLIAEDETQDVARTRAVESGGHGMDAVWTDDFHHSARVALTGRNEGYYCDFLGTPQEFISAAKRGFLYQGQRSRFQSRRRGTPAQHVALPRFVTYLQNHDQVANSGRGDRLDKLAAPGRYRAFTTLFLLGPWTPMLFQGQEFAASQPFLFFADHHPELAPLVAVGRARSLRQFRSLALPETQAALLDPCDPATFERCKLDFGEREKHAGIYALHRDLLRLRREDPVFREQGRHGIDGAVLGPQALVLRFFAEGGADRLLLLNWGVDLWYYPAPEPLLAPPEGMWWDELLSSDALRYGGCGTPPVDTDRGWRIPGETAIAFAAQMTEGHPDE